MRLILKDFKNWFPCSKSLSFGCKEAKGALYWVEQGQHVGFATPLKENRAEVMWTHLLNLLIRPFGSSRFCEHSCVESKWCHWIVLFLYQLQFLALVEHRSSISQPEKPTQTFLPRSATCSSAPCSSSPLTLPASESLKFPSKHSCDSCFL